MATEEVETKRKRRREWPEELAWPMSSEWRQFFLVLLPNQPKETPKEERIPARKARLSDLSDAELNWVARTVAIELQRRPLRKKPLPVEAGI